MSTNPAAVLAAVRFATGMAEAGKHVDMAQMAEETIKWRKWRFI
jgi:hypothetical protein